MTNWFAGNDLSFSSGITIHAVSKLQNEKCFHRQIANCWERKQIHLGEHTSTTTVNRRAPFLWEWHSRFLTWNQSIVQQLISDGNILSLFLKASPIGLIHNTTCRLRRTRSTKKLYIANGLESTFRFLSWTIFCIWLVKRVKQQFTQGTNLKIVVQKHHLYTQTKK